MKKTTLVLLWSVMFFLMSCSSGEVRFTAIVQEEIVTIESRYNGNGLLYSLSDKDLIATYVSIMNSTTYRKTKPYEPVSGNLGVSLRNTDNNVIMNIATNGQGVYKMGDDYYMMNDDLNVELSMFYQQLFSDAHLASE